MTTTYGVIASFSPAGGRPLWMKPYAFRCPGESRDPPICCSYRREVDPGFRRGSVQYCLSSRTALFLVSEAKQSRLEASWARRVKFAPSGRSGAVVKDEPHLFLAAARYIALNPVVAGLVRRAEDWPWSSARAHLAGEDDELATVAPLRALIADFAALLAAPADPATPARIERVPTIGRPLGSAEWIAVLERRLGRPLAPGKPGPKPRKGRDTARSAPLP